MNASCIIVDDEPVSRDILRKYIRDVPTLELSGECKDAFEASELLSSKKIDILFLDINLPGLSGISFARSLTSAPLIIFTTAYPEYAVEGFDLDAVDYLVKPFSFERFLKSTNRALEKIRQSHVTSETSPNLLVRSEKKIYSINPADITHIEGCGDYIKVFRINEDTLLVHETLKGFLSTLPSDIFLRIHKSFIVNTAKVEYLEGNMARVAGITIPVSPSSREELLGRLK